MAMTAEEARSWDTLGILTRGWQRPKHVNPQLLPRSVHVSGTRPEAEPEPGLEPRNSGLGCITASGVITASLLFTFYHVSIISLWFLLIYF